MRKQYTRGDITLSELLRNSAPSSNGCREWSGSAARNGYGCIRRNGKLFTVSRLIMHLKKGMPLESKLSVLHHCDNPKCINIKHLYTGTTQDNTTDKIKRDRHNRGRRVWKAKLHDTDVAKIFRLKSEGWNGADIARAYSISPSSIYRILQRKAWVHAKVD